MKVRSVLLFCATGVVALTAAGAASARLTPIQARSILSADIVADNALSRSLDKTTTSCNGNFNCALWAFAPFRSAMSKLSSALTRISTTPQARACGNSLFLEGDIVAHINVDVADYFIAQVPDGLAPILTRFERVREQIRATVAKCRRRI